MSFQDMSSAIPQQTPLSPVDHIFVGQDAYAIEFLLAFDFPLEKARLLKALQKTVAKFWPVGSRIARDSEGRLCFRACDEPLDFQELPPSQSLPNFEDPRQLSKFVGSVCSKPGGPLASFRLARVGGGSVFVATISHAVVDGYSYFFFLATLAAFYRRDYFSLKSWKQRLLTPDLDRGKLCSSEGRSSHRTSAVDPEGFYARTGIVLADERRLPSLTDSRWEFLRFSSEDLDRQLAEASREGSGRLSRHDLIAAMVLKKTAREWPSSDEVLEVSSAFDFRRIHPAMSPLYFGNAVRATVLRLSKPEVLELSLFALASKIRAATDAIDAKAVSDSLRCLEEAREVQGAGLFQRTHVSHPRRGLLVTNLSRVPLGSLDFGLGAPRRVVPLTPAPRSAIVLSEGKDLVARLALPI